MIFFIFSSLAIVICFMILVWVISLLVKDMSIVDVGWGLGFILVCLFNLTRLETIEPRQFIITFLVVLWGLRLAIYILNRNHGKGEDPRYKAWRADWGKNTWWISFYKVFLLQGFLMIIIALPLLMIMYQSGPILFLSDWIGVGIFLFGWLFETIGDTQLFRFKKNPLNKGKIMQSGLWRYTRHPNYFGEAVLWWGIFIISFGSGFWYISIIGPILITFMLLKVSGVTMLEQRYEGNTDYTNYKRKTSAFIPLPPKSP